MTALPIPEFELNHPQELADYLQSAKTWKEIEALTRDYSQWKAQAWELLSQNDRDRIKTLKQLADCPVAQQFPLGSIVQRRDDSENQCGEAIAYWRAYGIDYITFRVGDDIDWCRASNLQKVSHV